MATAVTFENVLLWLAAAAMVIVTAYCLKWFSLGIKHKHSILPLISVSTLGMMLFMAVSAVIYLEDPSYELLAALLIDNMLVMNILMIPMGVILFLRFISERKMKQPSQMAEDVKSNATTLMLGSCTVILVLLNEFFMGWAFQLASGGKFTFLDATNSISLFVSVVNSYWFVFPMAFEMVLTVFFLRKELRRELLYIVSLQSVIMFLSPTAITDTGWAAMTVVGGSVAMIILFVYVFDYLSKNSSIGRRFARYVPLLIATYALMMAGLFVWMVNGDGLLFAVSIIAEMLVYLSLVLRRVERQSPKAWREDAWWTVELLSLLFVAEFFMGAVLDVQVNGVESFFSAMGLAPLTGAPLVVVGAGLYDFVSFFGTVTSSPWFLIMMGAEMGVLVAFKARLAREFETKVRLVLVIVAYAVYTILLQNFLISPSLLPQIPFVGWSMGVGTSGPVAPMLLVGLIGTYLISGVLSFLFGSRQVCSMFCAAALMYQGTFYDSMKTFNRTSKIGRKYLTRNLSNLYKLTFSAVWVSIVCAAAISYLDSVGILSISIFGTDPARFACTFYFGFLWYLVFITIPFVGTYGCVSMGWCHWGTFNQLVGRLGFFKLRVRDPVTCAVCTTKDCAQACPVGLTALPASFISKGEFKSSRCIGVGDCVDACPYNNEYFYDVRNWVRQQLARLGSNI